MSPEHGRSLVSGTGSGIWEIVAEIQAGMRWDMGSGLYPVREVEWTAGSQFDFVDRIIKQLSVEAKTGVGVLADNATYLIGQLSLFRQQGVFVDTHVDHNGWALLLTEPKYGSTNIDFLLDRIGEKDEDRRPDYISRLSELAVNLQTTRVERNKAKAVCPRGNMFMPAKPVDVGHFIGVLPILESVIGEKPLPPLATVREAIYAIGCYGGVDQVSSLSKFVRSPGIFSQDICLLVVGALENIGGSCAVELLLTVFQGDFDNDVRLQAVMGLSSLFHKTYRQYRIGEDGPGEEK